MDMSFSKEFGATILAPRLLIVFFKRKRKKRKPKFIGKDFKKQVYDEKYYLQGGDFLSYPLDLNLSFKTLKQYLCFLL